MKRRDFLWGGYSLVVLADQIPPAPVTPTTVELQAQFDRLSPSSSRRRMAASEAHMILVDLETDLLVAGGGMAGVCAAISAARHGIKVILVQDRSRLGGNASSEVKMHIVGAHAQQGWREGGLIEELRLEDAVNNPQRSFELWDLLLYDKVISEPNITLLLDSAVFSARKKGDRIQEVMVRSDKTEHLYRIQAKFFCDSTGDSRLALEAGAEMRSGREPHSEFNESLAVDTVDNETHGSSILFTSRMFDHPMPFTPPRWARKVTKETVRLRDITELDFGYWWIAWGGNKNTIHDNERIRFELLSIVLGVWDYIKNSGDFPEAASRALDWVGMIPGKRGSRRIVGDHILTQHDLQRGDIEDAVAIGGWPMDDHPPGGFDSSTVPPNVFSRLTDVYNIPLRSLYSKNVPNMFMAGRNISCSHVAFTSTRVMATCSLEGQAVGTAAAMCVRDSILPRQIYQDKERLQALQQALLRDDQTIKNRANADPKDLARKARVKASAEEQPGCALKLLDGISRNYPRKDGPEIHQWTARLGPEGAWIELSWDTPQRIAHIQLTFDTGFHRMLMLMASATVTQRRGMIRGPQPETVRDYKIFYRRAAGGELMELASVKGNARRLNRHYFVPVDVQSLRIHVTASNGDALARIFEVRCYA